MYYAHKANLNVGIITSLFASTPLFTSIFDYLIYGTKVHPVHMFAVMMMILSSLIISLSDMIIPPTCAVNESQIIECLTPMWVPVTFSMATPFFFMIASLFMKHLTDKKVGFDSYTVSFGTTGLTSFVMMNIGVFWYWQSVDKFSPDLFLRGLAGSVCDNVGMAFLA